MSNGGNVSVGGGDVGEEDEDNDSAGGVDVGADNDDNGVDGHLDHEVGRLARLLPILLLLHSRHCSKNILPSLFHLLANHLEVVHGKLLFTFKETGGLSASPVSRL